MFGKIADAIKFGLAVGPVVGTLVGLIESPGNGPEKKAAVVQAVKRLIDEPGGLDCPAILKPYEELLIGAAIELVLIAAKLVPGFSGASGDK